MQQPPLFSPKHSGHTSTIKKPRVLLLFDYDWDAQGLGQLRDQFDFFHAGFDLFNFPSNARLIGFDLDRFVDKLLKEHRRRPFSGVISNHEQFGALAAALFAQKAGLVAPTPDSIVAAQHKAWMRTQLQQVAPQANLHYELLDCRLGDQPPQIAGFPHFAKPIKAAYSVLARVCQNQHDLEELIRFAWHETWVIHRLVEPFERIRKRILPQSPTAHGMMLEQPWRGEQFNLDGYMYQGQAHLLGVVDEVMYPGTQAFMSFDYPSKLPKSLQEKALNIAEKFFNRIGFDQSFFNMEFFADPQTEEIKVIEFNPRLGSQLADLYRRVDGVQVYPMQLALALGEDPRTVPRLSNRVSCASSFVFRRFGSVDDILSQSGTETTAEQRAKFQRNFPDALLLEFKKSKVGLGRELKWLGSQRYGIFHLGANSQAELDRLYLQACESLGWRPAPLEAGRATFQPNLESV